MANVNTVTGPVDSGRLGFTLSHEHVMIMAAWRYLPFLFDRDGSVAKGIRLLKAAKSGGVDSLIELSTIDIGREVLVMQEISEATGVNIIAATGLWRPIPFVFWQRDADFIARFMFHEIEHGIDGTSVKPGVIKMASDAEGVTELAEKALRAAARVAKETGVPISTHQWAPEEVGRRQVEVLVDEGVPMHLVCIGHSADTPDDAFLEDLLKEGCYLSMNRYPAGFGGLQWHDRNATVKRLIDRGWASRIMLGHDYPPKSVMVDTVDEPEDDPVRYTFLKRVAIPGLISDGVSEDQIRLIMEEVPRRFLTGEKPIERAASG